MPSAAELRVAWKALAHRIATVQARVFFAIVYVVVLAPFAALLRVTGDPFRADGWHQHESSGTPEREAARNQF